MFTFRLEPTLKNLARPFMKISRNYQVAVVGASYPLGQPLSIMLMQNHLVQRLVLYDLPEGSLGDTKGLYGIPREPTVKDCKDWMQHTLRGSNLVVVAGGQPRQPEQTDNSLFKNNADFIITAMQKIINNCPTAFIVIATEPINYTLPLASKVLESGDGYNKKKVFGVTVLDTMRTQALISNMYNLPPDQIKVPVVCGHSSKTTVPLLSHVIPRLGIDHSAASTITENVRNDEDTKVCGFGRTTLSASHATYCTAAAILEAMNGFTIEHVAFIANNDFGTKFFASPLIITWRGISAIMDLRSATELEYDYMDQATEQLAKEVRSGQLYSIRARDRPDVS